MRTLRSALASGELEPVKMFSAFHLDFLGARRTGTCWLSSTAAFGKILRPDLLSFADGDVFCGEWGELDFDSLRLLDGLASATSSSPKDDRGEEWGESWLTPDMFSPSSGCTDMTKVFT